ncbi:MAG TPA: hypothetical protein VFG50_10980 [Rhodothermales bacterium]|nr:hypothetical protein [Rhodothermales bacterium]
MHSPFLTPRLATLCLLTLLLASCDAAGPRQGGSEGETAGPTLTQNPEGGPRFPEIPTPPYAKPTAEQVNAAEQFRSEHPEWKVEWGDGSGSRVSLLGGSPIAVGQGTPLEIARQFLDDHRKLFDLTSGLPNLAPVKIENHLRANHVIFQQTYEGIPVEGGIFAVNMTKKGEVYYVTADYLDDVQVERTSPAVSQEKAIDIAKSDLGPDLELLGKPESKLVILPYGAAFRLAWKVIVPTEEPLGRWLYYLSARDGSVLGGYDTADTDPGWPQCCE